MPARNWRDFGDKRERRRLEREGIRYDPNIKVDGATLTAEFAALPWLPGREPKFDKPTIVAPRDWCIWLGEGAAWEYVPGEEETRCTKWARHVADVFPWWVNNHGGGTIAAWKCTAQSIAWHGGPGQPPHDFVLVRTSDDGIWVFDAAFMQGDRGVYRPSGYGYYGLER